MTNFEWMKTLSVKELAQVMSHAIYCAGEGCPYQFDPLRLCRHCVADWLEREYEED